MSGDTSAVEYDVALSCAPEDAEYVSEVAAQLRARGVRVFFAPDEDAELWGRDLVVIFDEVFRTRARFAMLFISEHYVEGPWTAFQHLSTQARSLIEENAYVLPVRLDDTSLPGLRPTIAFQDARKTTVEHLVDLFVQKLARPAAAAVAPPRPLQAAQAVAEALRDVGLQDVPSAVIEVALSRAIQTYATSGARLGLATPLLDADGFLAEPAIAAELAHVLSGDRRPDAELISRRWAEAARISAGSQDFAHEAAILLRRLEGELHGLAPEARGLAAIAVTAETLREVRAQLQGLRELLTASYHELIARFAAAPVRDRVVDWTSQIEEKSRDFVGRRFWFDRVREFVDGSARGYFFIQGEPGIGKTAFAAQLVKTRRLVHHFNSLSSGFFRPDAFLGNVCAQLIAVHGLPYSALPEGTTENATVLNRLLREVSDRLGPDDKAIVVVDALDEVVMSDREPGVNTLYLPEVLPRGVFFVVTTRPAPPPLPRVDCETDGMLIDPQSPTNMADVRELVGLSLDRPGIQRYDWAQALDERQFVEFLADLSAGNFMYLHHVLPEIERGAYRDTRLEKLPAGLERYYQDQWERMRGSNEEAWFAYRLPVVATLTVVREPVSLELLARFSGVQQRARIQAVLDQWRPFLLVTEVAGPAGPQHRYQIYHKSFHDFLRRQAEVAQQHFDLDLARDRINSYLLDKAMRGD